MTMTKWEKERHRNSLCVLQLGLHYDVKGGAAGSDGTEVGETVGGGGGEEGVSQVAWQCD